MPPGRALRRAAGDSSVLCGEAFHDQGHDADQVAHGTHDGDVQGRGLRSRIVDRDEVDVRSQRNAGQNEYGEAADQGRHWLPPAARR